MIAVELSLRQLMEAVRQMSPSEKLELSEMIWQEDVSIPLEHQKIVNERMEKAQVKPEMLLDWDIALKTLKA